jgi:hypothetical protein
MNKYIYTDINIDICKYKYMNKYIYTYINIDICKYKNKLYVVYIYIWKYMHINIYM